MPQYSNSFSLSGGGTVSGVLNTESNTVTYTVASPKGQTASLTLSRGDDPRSVPNLNNIRQQIRAQGGSDLDVAGFGAALQAVQANTEDSASRAAAVATTTGEPVADNPTPPPPVAANTDPTTPTVGIVPEPTQIQSAPVEEPQPTPDFQFAEANVIEQQTINPDDDNAATLATLAQQAELEANVIEQQSVSEADDVAAALADAEARVAAVDAAGVGISTPPDVTADDAAYSAQQGVLANEEAEVAGAAPGTAFPSTTAQSPTDPNVGANNNANQANAAKFKRAQDWRVRISLAPDADYLYKDPSLKSLQNGILFPLISTNGVVFPYVPTVSLTYAANYDATDPTHSNYRIFSYRNSAVSDITITGEFTAQNTAEALYLRAVIHFFRSATKMFYGRDQSPRAGTPPPLVYLSGFGQYQFDNHPMVISSFGYTLPNDVDYILAGTVSLQAPQSSGIDYSPPSKSIFEPFTSQFKRLQASRLQKGALNPPPQFRPSVSNDTTRIPTKMNISITCHPIVTRRVVSDKFSVKSYATGKLLNGSETSGYGGGIW